MGAKETSVLNRSPFIGSLARCSWIPQAGQFRHKGGNGAWGLSVFTCQRTMGLEAVCLYKSTQSRSWTVCLGCGNKTRTDNPTNMAMMMRTSYFCAHLCVISMPSHLTVYLHLVIWRPLHQNSPLLCVEMSITQRAQFHFRICSHQIAPALWISVVCM